MDRSQSKYIEINGINTRYFEKGSGDPVILIHGGHFGGGASAEDWFLNFDRLAEKYHVYAFDKVGQGHTDNPKKDTDYIMGTQVKHASEFIKKLNIQKPHLIGHSRGGYIVTRLAIEYPEIPKSIVIIDSATLMQDISFYHDLADRAPSFSNTHEKIKYMIKENSWGDKHITDEWIEGNIEYSKSEKNIMAATKHSELEEKIFTKDLIERQKETHQWIREGKLNTPTLETWGLDDPSAFWDPIGINCLNLILPNVKNSSMHIFNNAGHYVFREQPVRLAKEEEGVGISAGAHFAGLKSAMLMQNHGFLASVNGIVSLAQLYRIPLLMIISYRGEMGETDPWQTEGGLRTESTLKALDIPYDIIDSPESVEKKINKAAVLSESSERPVALLITRDLMVE